MHENIYERKERIRKPWITEEMMNKMDERRKWKNKNDEEGRKMYRQQLNNEVRREAVKAKEKWWKKECGELEERNSKGRSDLV